MQWSYLKTISHSADQPFNWEGEAATPFPNSQHLEFSIYWEGFWVKSHCWFRNEYCVHWVLLYRQFLLEPVLFLMSLYSLPPFYYLFPKGKVELKYLLSYCHTSKPMFPLCDLKHKNLSMNLAWYFSSHLLRK